MTRLTIDFDSNDWMPELRSGLQDLLPGDIDLRLRNAEPEFKEDAVDLLCSVSSDHEAVIDRTLNWINDADVLAFHGTRLTEEEAGGLWKSGLRALDFDERIEWLFRTIPEIAGSLTKQQATSLAHNHNMGNREGQVHLAISRQFTTLGYDYHRAGSEFDRRLIQFAGLNQLLPSLTGRGQSWLVTIRLPGGQALAGMHPYFPIEFTRQNDRYPNLVRQILEEFTWQLYRPDSKRWPVDACFMFRESIPGSSVEAVERLE